MPYGVIHQDIFDSSLAGDHRARHLFQDLIILADEDDNVMMDAIRIAHRTRVPIEVVEGSLSVLTAEDPLSKSQLEKGRRLVPILNNGSGLVIGYHVVNRHHYKRMISRVRRRQYMRTYRAKKQDADWEARFPKDGRSPV